MTLELFHNFDFSSALTCQLKSFTRYIAENRRQKLLTYIFNNVKFYSFMLGDADIVEYQVVVIQFKIVRLKRQLEITYQFFSPFFPPRIISFFNPCVCRYIQVSQWRFVGNSCCSYFGLGN